MNQIPSPGPYLGTDGNGIKFQLIAPISDCPATFAEYDKVMRTLRVHLKGLAGLECLNLLLVFLHVGLQLLLGA